MEEERRREGSGEGMRKRRQEEGRRGDEKFGEYIDY